MGEKFNFKFFETSAKTGQNLNEGFEYLVKEILGDIDPVKRSRKEGIYFSGNVLVVRRTGI